MLAEARTFSDWLVQRRYLRSNPFQDVVGGGRRKLGKHKPKLYMDETRKWLGTAENFADQGNVGAVMAMMAVLMDMRAEEIVLRDVRDVDDGRRVLWTESKTEAGTRRLRIPPQLQRHIAKLVLNRERASRCSSRRGQARGTTTEPCPGNGRTGSQPLRVFRRSEPMVCVGRSRRCEPPSGRRSNPPPSRWGTRTRRPGPTATSIPT